MNKRTYVQIHKANYYGIYFIFRGHYLTLFQFNLTSRLKFSKNNSDLPNSLTKDYIHKEY